ncbi:hypothetical protein HPB48_021059 [Haemaphysalis longicornis]|uniref:non-specific serine/threonine protein kinase n=1 Tax=Haemaphysalis longicornis TaxID=44386 RepID=A0A9J6GUS8_HAELO|nr:hypothetical protein HPB48_021059 [Haemaphysalis longicornis]
MPKVVTCFGQDGRSYKQLVKGRDDLRQDAVMQQAFGLVNRLLDQEKKGHTGGRLAMRTYKVFLHSTLALRALELIGLNSGTQLTNPAWCSGVRARSPSPIPADQQTGAPPALPARTDWAPMACRKAMQEVHKSPPEERLQAYLEVCSHFHPVFRYFFFEHFPEPSRWFERRRAYVHSVATGSIVGYILGLGDRHCANILVDKHSAELIHIDLGVAFEQGRTLNTPETVPFPPHPGCRGRHGDLRCGGHLPKVLRAHHGAPSGQPALQADGSGGGDDRRRSPHPGARGSGAAPQQHDQSECLLVPRTGWHRRMLLRLEQKLQGLEEGPPSAFAGQVNLLIQQAIDPHNLSRLFPGWQPYV